MSADFLKNVPYLASLSEAELAELAQHAEHYSVPAHTRILTQDEPVDSLYFVLKGVVHVRSKASDHEVLLARIGEGGFFGEINLFVGDTATASVVSVETCELAKIPYAKFREYMDTHPITGYAVLSALVVELATRLRKTNERLSNSVFWGR